jgi:hypothetical protein
MNINVMTLHDMMNLIGRMNLSDEDTREVTNMFGYCIDEITSKEIEEPVETIQPLINFIKDNAWRLKR